ncbi:MULTISPECIES: hypothetical protein [unclassified Azospirillum]|uniref:hypothetical protein n=1 Tax=unclassified Azospirillum TaxID=2630922 RepID=UPI000B7130E3|nr:MULTISPECIES: hypothetical protein [unclassified Azospirillum]SNS13233.1 hypothetical protein SAMN05880556_102121 [Azospirillum sp. RU38E]SNS30312.1 hypothetical protein SAMN05880591_102121 [Azospirillum sp. RU37A]
MILYGFPLCLLYLVTGLARTLWLDHRIGALAGALVELSSFLVAGLCWLIVTEGGRAGGIRLKQYPLGAGMAALALFFITDAAIATCLCGVPLFLHLARFTTLAGLIQLMGLAGYAALPLLWHGRE